MFVAWNGTKWVDIEEDHVEWAQGKGYEVREIDMLRRKEDWLDPNQHQGYVNVEMTVGMEKIDEYLRAF